MVFESIATDLINRFLGDYVENLDKNQLKIGIWGGDVVLNNLALRQNALDDLDLPVQIVYGHLGKLVLKIPWKNLYSEPVVAQIEDLYVLVSPNQSVQYDAEKEAKYELMGKQNELQKIDDARKQELEKNKPKPDKSFAEKLTAQIVNNLQIKIANVHIRYEDKTTNDVPFSIGITLHGLDFFTTDCNWTKSYMTEQLSKVFKVANLDSLSAYMNCNTFQFTKQDPANYPKLFKESIGMKDSLPENFRYILGPITSMAKLQLNMNPEYDEPPFIIPKINLALEMEKLNVGITRSQFQDVLKLGDSMNRMKLGAPYREYRPFGIGYRGHYKEWWHFAITCILEKDVRRRNREWSWNHIKQHRSMIQKYAEAYKEKLLSKKPAATLVETCNLCEQKLDLFNLVLIRNRVHLEVDKLKKEEEKKQTQKGSWFGSWWGGSKQSENSDGKENIVTQFEAAMTPEEKAKLYKAIGYQENAVQATIPEEYEAVKMNFKLGGLEIGVRDDSSCTSTSNFSELQQILCLRLSIVTCEVSQRPAANAIKANVTMKELIVSGYKRDNFTPVLVESQVPDHHTLLDIHFETNPLDKKCDQRVKLLARPLQIVYDAETIIQLTKVFTTPKTVNLSQLEGAAADRLANIKERSATGIQYMVEKHDRLELNIECMPNIVIIPYGGMYISGYTSSIVISLGQLNISTIPRASEIKDVQAMHVSGSNKEEILQTMMNQSYDKFKLTIADIQILVAKPKEKWMDALVEDIQSEMHVLRPTSLILTADVCVIDDDPRLPKTKIGILLPEIGINVTEERVLDALSVITSIPFPEGDKIESAPLTKASSLVTSSMSLLKFLDSEKDKMAKKAVVKPETSAEIVQYTDLEVTFAMHELTIAIFKARGDKDTPSDQYKTPTEEFDGLPVEDPGSNLVGASVQSEHEKILSVKVMQLEANMAQRTYEMVVSVKLGAVQMNQYDKWDGEENVLTIIDTPGFTEEMEYLLTILYINANKISPEFITKYSSTEQCVTVNFSTLVLTLHQECIKDLLQIANNFQKRIEEINSNSNNENKDRIASAGESENFLTVIKSNLETIEEEPGSAKPTRALKKGKVVDSIKFKVIANLEQVTVELTCRKRPIASLKVQNLHAGVIMKSSYTELTLKLKDILVVDLNPLSIHSTILSIIGENALYCQIVMFNLDETSNYNSDDLKIDVSMGCVKIVFLNWFVTSVLTFLGNFQAAQQAIADASAAAADAAKQNVVDAYEKATRMKLHIKIKAPLIIVPVDSQSLQAISLDLGFLSITNSCSEVVVPEENRSPAVLDEMKLELKEMKLSKAHIVQTDDSGTNGRSSTGSVSDLIYGLKSNVNILDPISFNLVVLRNLSSGWYKEKPELDVSGRLKSIELNLLVEDYVLLMSIISKNLSEGQDEFPSSTSTVPIQTAKPKNGEAIITNVEIHHEEGNGDDAKKIVKRVETKPIVPSSVSVVGEKKKIDVQLKFNFQIDGVVANLITANNEGLASFGLYFLSLKGHKLVDGTLSTSIVLCDIQLDDIRSTSESKITKYLRRKESKMDVSKTECGKTSSMLDIVASIKDNDTFAEIRICGFDLIISIDFLLKIAEFFKIPEDETSPTTLEVKPTDNKAVVTASRTPAQTKKTTQTNPDADKHLHVILHLEEPDIILVENMDDINTHAIIFNSEISLKARIYGEKQIINGEIKDLKMYMCSFEPERREATKHYIIHPCTLSLQGSTPEGRGLNLSIKLSEVVINVSPATIELINKAITTLTSNGNKISDVIEQHDDYSDIWGVKEFKEEDFWFFKIDEACEAMELEDTTETKPETCIIEVPSILLVIETGVGYYTSPMLFIETKMSATVNDWSKNMNMNGSLNLCMSYFNSALAVWEPLIEQNERKLSNDSIEYGPWELNFDLRLDSKKSDDLESDMDNMTRIMIHSRDVLELTLSKTSLEVLQMLGQAFSQAFDVGGLVKPDVIAPYIIENDTGFDISVDFTKGLFTLHECHMPNVNVNFNESINKSLVFQTDDNNIQISPDDVKSCKISPGGRIYLQTKHPRNKSVTSNISALTANIPDNEEVLHVQIGDITKDIVLPVHKADQRYFPLYRDTNKEPWGIISDVRSEYGTTKINIHGVVKIRNHFTNAVSIYRMRNEKPFLIGDVLPGTDFNVPLHAIYAPVKDLFFALPGYKCSVQGINWKDSPTDLQFTKNLQCDPISTFEPLYITAIREKTEVFHENTSKFTLLSACYTIHLRPPLYLRNALPISMVVSVAGCSVGQDGVPKGIELVEQSAKSAVKEDFLDYGEKEVKPGDVLHLPTVKLTSRGGEAKSYIVARLIQYLEKDWSCTTEISENHEDFAVWTFTAYDSVDKMEIELGVRFENRHGSLMVTIYCPFWMINKTGLMLSYRKSRKTEKNELSGVPSKANDESINVLYHPPEYEGPILFSFREKSFFGKKRASIRVDSGEWSEKIPLDVAGSEGVVQCKANDMVYQIAVHNHLTQNSLTKQITFLPFYVLINKAYFPIEVQEENRSADPWTKIDPNECTPLWPKTDTNHMLRVKACDHRHISRPFKYTDVQCTLLMMKNQYGGINVDVQVTEGGIYITFSEYHKGDAPGLIINHTNKEISFWEKGNINKRTLTPYQKMLYTWADPAGEKIILWETGKGHVENDLRRDGVDEFLLNESESDMAYWVSFLNGTQRVLLFTSESNIASEAQSTSQLEKVTQEIEISIHGIGLSIVNNMKQTDILYLGIASSGVIWESRKTGKTRYKQMKIAQSSILESRYQEYLCAKEVGDIDRHYFLEGSKFQIDFDNMTLQKNSERDIRRTFYPGLWLQLKTSSFQTQIHAKINRIQIDNQLLDCIFPVVLAPVAPPKSVAATTALKPFVECSIVQRIIPHSTVKQFKYCCMLIQEFHVKVDLIFITELAEIFSQEISDEDAAKLFNQDVEHIVKPLSELVATHTLQEQKNFYDNLHLGPLKIHVSFSMAGSDTSALPGILSTILQGVGVTLTDINDVVFRLAFFEREYQFFTQRQLISEISSHYVGQAVKQLYVLVLGLDVLGNPYGLVVGLTKGVEDLFYEPFQGAIQGPGEFAEGLVLGVKSLFGHTVGGAAGAVSKITGAMGKGLAALTFDKDYQRKRREALNKKPTNFQEGIARSGKGLVMGVVDGVTGVVMKPISGAKEEGVEGFFKGLGKGAVGLFARPTAGVVDFASGSFEAVKRATETTDEVQRLRPPRFLHSDGVVRPYSHQEAQGNKLLKEIDKGKYAQTDVFSHFEEILDKREILLLSNHRVIYSCKNDLFGHWCIQWTYRWNEIHLIRSSDRGVEVLLKKEGRKVLGLFSSSEEQKKLILIPQRSRREKLAKLMDSLKQQAAKN